VSRSDSTEPIPAGTPMPTPVPPGRFAEYAAAISEGFCPACRVPLDPWPPMPSGPRGDCRDCGASWFLDVAGPTIQWFNYVDYISWTIWTMPDPEVPGGAQIRGTAMWAE